ncbi:hypothetical protein VIGAN_07026100 [Vigna angularis var. angularis]|uniref:Uncharacterized protein n=1 Tax=Vigna angularis var. angularis TaxID=157739 RepID=A0A0S3SFM5_PHAAN|nr:hypothetical protein VIGAN_07026100 [Vigna angularis var. angularis]
MGRWNYVVGRNRDSHSSFGREFQAIMEAHSTASEDPSLKGTEQDRSCSGHCAKIFSYSRSFIPRSSLPKLRNYHTSYIIKASPFFQNFTNIPLG